MELSTLPSLHFSRSICTAEVRQPGCCGIGSGFATAASRIEPRLGGGAAVLRRASHGYGVGCEFSIPRFVLGSLDHKLGEKLLRRAVRSGASGLRNRREWRCMNAEFGADASNAGSPGSVHFVGIGGAGLSALGLLALRQGWQVSGSDLVWSEEVIRLKEAGARAYVGHSVAQLVPQGSQPPDAVVVSSAVGPGNEEVEAARALNVPIYKRGDWLGKITEGYQLIAVAGTHGKTTTTAMLSVVLRNLGEDITAIVGAQVPQFPDGGSALCGTTRKFVLEADEYDGCFLGVSPHLAVLTNVEWEHVDMFPDEEAVKNMFKKFVLQIKPGGCLVACGDSAGAKSVLGLIEEEQEKDLGSPFPRERRVVTFGLGASDWRAIMLVPNPQGGTDYTVVYKNRPMTRVSLRLPGMYNVLNSLAVIVVMSLLAAEKESDVGAQAKLMKRTAEAAGRALGAFSGVRRRFDFVGSVHGCHIIDDYAHHPTEVRAVLQAARQRYDQQPIWVIFQPHTVSRLAAFLPDFAPAFSAADRVIVTQVYAARNIPTEKVVTGEDLANAIIGPPAVYIPDLVILPTWVDDSCRHVKSHHDRTLLRKPKFYSASIPERRQLYVGGMSLLVSSLAHTHHMILFLM
uniref:UDP-N-acetylmuramate--L-alanine ligase n=1 Tax=Physcomitrium patens TaxID=3218 RepID=A0A7I4CHL3_PHYPA